MRAAKWILIVIGALVALLAAGALYVTQVVDANRYKPDIERAVREATGRDLQLVGDIQLSVFPWIALETGAGSLGNPSGFAGAPLVAWSEARVAARLLPLLRDRLVIDRIRFSGARVSLHRLADGRANWDGWGEPPASDGKAANNHIDIAGLELTDATLEYRDDRSGDTLVLERWQLETSAIRGTEPVDIETEFVARSGTAAGPDVQPASAELAVAARYVPLEGRTLVENFALEGRVMRGATEPLPVTLAVPRIEVVGGATLSRTTWRADVGSLEASGAVEGTLGEPVALAGEVRANAKNLRELLAALGSSAPATRDPEVFGAFDASMQWQYGAAGLTTQSLALSLDNTRMTGSLALRPVAPRVMTFALNGDAIDLTRYLEPEDTVSEPFVFPTATLKALPARGVLEFARAQLGDAELDSVRIRLIIDDAGARSEALKQP